MKRKAVLIESSNVSGQKDLPGARRDIENWEAYLKSDLGGRWFDSEIVALHKPFSTDVAKQLSDTCDYYLVVFSGHGCDGSVVLNDYLSDYSISCLNPKSSRGTLIVDSCRGVEDASDLMGKMSSLNESGPIALANSANESNFTSTRSRRHREIFDKSLISSGNGIVTMLSCASGQSAGENPKAGGYYTSLLFQASGKWAHGVIASGSTEAVYNTKQAHDYAVSLLSISKKPQNPEYAPPNLSFPFAVYVKQPTRLFS